MKLAELPDLIRTGRLDLMLLLPVDSQFAVSTRKFGLDNMVNALVGVAIVVFSLWKLAIVPQPHQVALFTVGIALAVGVHYSVMFGLATGAIWIMRAQGLIYGYFNVFNIARYPASVFRGAFKFIFSFIIPVILVANVPAQALARALESPWAGLAQLAGATVFVVAATRGFWHFALRRYSSASS